MHTMHFAAIRTFTVCAILIGIGALWGVAEAESNLLDTALGRVLDKEYQFSLLLCTGEPTPECELDSAHGTKPFLIRAQQMSPEGVLIGDPLALVRVPEMPLSIPMGRPKPVPGCKLAWDPNTSTLWAVSSASLETSLFIMLLPITVGSGTNGTVLDASIPEVSTGGLSFGQEELNLVNALPRVRDASFEGHSLTIRLESRDPDRASESLPVVVFDTETSSWIDTELAEPAPPDPPPSDPE